ncbi:MAG: hypothetical protein Q7K65_04155 [Candidatus Buchananbacteria bacterium]|nr:hypothetical protein [Candidatus Buchananbacteria bacterium]
MINKIREKIIYLVRNFFLMTRNIKLCRYFGIGIYKIGLHYAIYKLKKVPEIEAIYSATDFFSDDFLPGESDIDLVVVLKEQTEPDKIFDMRIKLDKIIDKIILYFPFISEPEFFGAEEFDFDNMCGKPGKIRRYKKDFGNLFFICGEDKRKNLTPHEQETVPPKAMFRFFLAALLFFSLENISGKKNLRRARKFFSYVLYLGFFFKYRRRAIDNQEYLRYLKEIGAPTEFLTLFPGLKEFDFNYRYDLLPMIIFTVIKITESLNNFEEESEIYEEEITGDFTIKLSDELEGLLYSVDKRHICSIYHMPSCAYWGEYSTQSIYVIIPDGIRYEDFKAVFDSFFDKVKSARLPWITPPIFDPYLGIFDPALHRTPFIYLLTEKALKSPYFFNGNEASELDLFGNKIFGKKINFSGLAPRSASKTIEKNGSIGRYIQARFLQTLDNRHLRNLIQRIKFLRIAEEKNLFFYGDIEKKYKEIYGEDGPDINDKKDIYRFFYEHAIKGRLK